MIYEIKGKSLKVSNEIEEYEELIFGRFSQFKKIDTENTSNYINFKQNKVEIEINGYHKVLKNRIIKTDIYPIINNIIAYLINDENNILMHSIVVSKDNVGLLIVGNFGQGKSTLAKEFEKNGYEINSTDQTWLEIRNGELYQKIGSRFDIKNNEVELLEEKNSNKNIRIEKIIRILGLCDNGNCFVETNNNEYHKIKNLATFCNWNYIMPIFTDDIELYNTNIFVKAFLEKLIKTDIDFLDVRGDKSKILKELGVIK